MVRERRSKAREDSSLEIESPPSSDLEATQAHGPVPARGKRKAVASKIPKRAQGRGRPTIVGASGHGQRPRMKRASSPRAQEEGQGDSLKYLEQMIIRMTPPIRRTPPSYVRHRPMNYMKGKHNFYNMRYEHPRDYPKEMRDFGYGFR